MWGWFNIFKSTNEIHHINKLKNKIHVTIRIDSELEFDKYEILS